MTNEPMTYADSLEIRLQLVGLASRLKRELQTYVDHDFGSRFPELFEYKLREVESNQRMIDLMRKRMAYPE